MKRLWWAAAVTTAVFLLASGPRARATVEMQNTAKKLGYPVKNCLYCHASPHAVEKMKEKAREIGMGSGNCLLCHGQEIPATLNDRGLWLVAEKARREAEELDMAWLADYQEPSPEESPEPEDEGPVTVAP